MTQDDVVRQSLSHFFNIENIDSLMKKLGWRGCVLDRDNYSDAGLPKLLWVSLGSVIERDFVTVCGYFCGKAGCESLALDWDQYAKFMHDPKRFSVEYVIYDDDRQWVIWRDLDTTTLILNGRLANILDSVLARSNTSLIELTRNNFDGAAIRPFILSVLGQQPSIED